MIGGEYARREGFPAEVTGAIAAQYDPGRLGTPSNAADRTAVRLVIADQLDKLAGYLGQGLEPTGSSDPFALRRAATVLIEAAWNWPTALPSYDSLFDYALAQYEAQGIALDGAKAHAALGALFASRYQALLPEVRYDILEAAVLPEEATLPRKVRLRIGVLESLTDDTPFVQTLTRPLNIVAAAKKKGIAYATANPLRELDVAKLDSAEGLNLHLTLLETEGPLKQAVAGENVEEVITHLRRLAAPINQFFDTTMVMAEDSGARHARLTLLEACCQQILEGGDFSKLVIEG